MKQEIIPARNNSFGGFTTKLCVQGKLPRVKTELIVYRKLTLILTQLTNAHFIVQFFFYPSFQMRF